MNLIFISCTTNADGNSPGGRRHNLFCVYCSSLGEKGEGVKWCVTVFRPSQHRTIKKIPILIIASVKAIKTDSAAFLLREMGNRTFCVEFAENPVFALVAI